MRTSDNKSEVLKVFSPELRKHLENLGFVVGGNVTVVAMLGGNVIVKVKEARVAISEEAARRVMI